MYKITKEQQKTVYNHSWVVNIGSEKGVSYELLQSGMASWKTEVYVLKLSWHVLHLKSIGTSISVKQQDEKPGHPISSGDES